MALTDIVGVNAAARKSQHLHGTVQARMTTLVPANAGNNVGIAKEKDERIKSRKVPQRKVGETFAFLESVIESEISWVKSEKHSVELLRTRVVHPGTDKTMTLYCTPEPSTEEQEIVFDYTRFAEVEAYGLKTGRTRLDDGGLLVGTKGQFLTISYGSSAPPPISRPGRPSTSASSPATAPSAQQQYDLVPELPPTFATSCGDYRVFFYKDERWRSGRVQTCELGTGRTASCMLAVKVYMVEDDDKLLKPVAEPYMERNFRAIHSAYHGTGIRDAGSNGRWFLHKEAPANPHVALPADRSAAVPVPANNPPTTVSSTPTARSTSSATLPATLPAQSKLVWPKSCIKKHGPTARR